MLDTHREVTLALQPSERYAQRIGFVGRPRIISRAFSSKRVLMTVPKR